MKCPICGNKLTSYDDFCKNCGYQITIEDRQRRNASILSFAFPILFLLVAFVFVGYFAFNKYQFDNALNNKNFDGKIILVQSPKDKPFKQIALGIQTKLGKEFGTDVYIDKYYENKALIFVESGISPEVVISCLSNPMLSLKKQMDYDGEWVDTGINEKLIKKAQVVADSNGQWTINIDFNEEGRKKLAKVTKEMVGKPLGIFFNGELQCAPLIREPITGGSAMISGGVDGFTHDEAKAYADMMQSNIDLEVLDIR